MAIIKNKCPFCKKDAVAVSNLGVLGSSKLLSLECGHTVVESALVGGTKIRPEMVSSDGHKPFPHQWLGVDFFEDAINNTRARGILANWEMRVGKTILSAMLLKTHPELFPAVLVCKGSLTTQMFHEFERWIGIWAQVIETGRDKPHPKMKLIIVSYDLLPKMDWSGFDGVEGRPSINCIFLDEVQHIKNRDTKRAKAVQDLAKKYPDAKLVATSGTPIKNNAAEYFTILNLLDPYTFYRYNSFIRDYVEVYSDGRATRLGGIKKWKLQSFLDKTKGYVQYLSRAEVLPDLPTIQRSIQMHELGSKVQDAYNRYLDLFEEEYHKQNGKMGPGSNVLAFMSKMRHLTGLAKVKPTIDYVTDFLYDTEDKITLFHHHIDVGELLERELTKLLSEGNYKPALILRGGMDAETRSRIIDEFNTDPSRRILVASTQASGEGINLPSCSDVIMVERQWNPANEEQAEARFAGFGNTSQHINVIYMTAIGTIDEFFAELVERKREVVGKTLTGQASKWDESSLMRELAERLMQSGKSKWKVS